MAKESQECDPMDLSWLEATATLVEFTLFCSAFYDGYNLT